MINEISNITENIVSKMDSTIVGVWNSTDERFDTCKTKWARSGKEITDASSNKFMIDQVNPNEWLILKPSAGVIQSGIVQLPKPFFITGTKIATNKEWTLKDNNLTKKTPLIWLLGSIISERFGKESTIDFIADLRLFFLDETNIVNYYTSDHILNVVYPMEQLVAEFLNTIKKDRNFGTIESWEIIDFARFGVESEQGMIKNILDANLSGVELRLKLKKYKENCKC
jgi:hypothetical protein